MESRKAFYIVKELLETGTELYETAGSVDFWLKIKQGNTFFIYRDPIFWNGKKTDQENEREFRNTIHE